MSHNPAILTEQARTIKGLLYGQKNSFSTEKNTGNLGGQNGRIMPAWVANQNTGFALSCPTVDSAV